MLTDLVIAACHLVVLEAYHLATQQLARNAGICVCVC